MTLNGEIREKSASVAAPHSSADGFWPAVAAVVAAPARWFGQRLGRPRASAQLGPYTLDVKIGQGAMGVVYRANHAGLGRPAAVKVLPPERAREEDVRRLEREARLTSRLTHPNTIAVFDFGRTREGAFYYAMEYIDGLDLQTLVERDGAQHPARVAHLLAQLAGALAEAHAEGLVHRDIKPANVMVGEGAGDVLKVLDFGLATDVRGGDVTVSELRRVVGTPLYLSPEGVTAPESVDSRSDLYALGAVGYFLLTGVPPFSGKSAIEVCAQHVCEAPVPPSARRAGIPTGLEALILACLAKSPADRPASAALLRAELLGFAAEWTEERAARWWSGRSPTQAPAPLAA